MRVRDDVLLFWIGVFALAAGVALAALAAGCGPKEVDVQVQAATIVAVTADALGPKLADEYRVQKSQCSTLTPAGQVDVAKRDSCEENLSVQWARITSAWDALRMADHAWAAMLIRERAGLPQLDPGSLISVGMDVHDSWCALRCAGRGVVSIPDVPGVPCGVVCAGVSP